MKKTYKIDVDCANCANKMEEAARKTEGVQSATVNFMALKMIVEFAEGQDLVKRIAAQDTPERQPAALEGAVLLNRLQRILGTGGNIPAARRPVRGDGHPVKFHQGQQDLFHHDRSSSSSSFLQRRRKVSFSSFQEAVRVRPLATRIMSYPWRSRPELSR